MPLDPARVHPMPAADGPDGADVDAAAARYAAELAAARPGRGADVPTFDVLLLGVGPDGHVASLFPEHPALHETRATVVGGARRPKPPPARISLTSARRRTAEVWFLVAGADKADAVGLALSGAGRGAGARPAGVDAARRATTWLLDRTPPRTCRRRWSGSPAPDGALRRATRDGHPAAAEASVVAVSGGSAG